MLSVFIPNATMSDVYNNRLTRNLVDAGWSVSKLRKCSEAKIKELFDQFTPHMVQINESKYGTGTSERIDETKRGQLFENWVKTIDQASRHYVKYGNYKCAAVYAIANKQFETVKWLKNQGCELHEELFALDHTHGRDGLYTAKDDEWVTWARDRLAASGFEWG